MRQVQTGFGDLVGFNITVRRNGNVVASQLLRTTRVETQASVTGLQNLVPHTVTVATINTFGSLALRCAAV